MLNQGSADDALQNSRDVPEFGPKLRAGWFSRNRPSLGPAGFLLLSFG